MAVSPGESLFELSLLRLLKSSNSKRYTEYIVLITTEVSGRDVSVVVCTDSEHIMTGSRWASKSTLKKSAVTCDYVVSTCGNSTYLSWIVNGY